VAKKYYAGASFHQLGGGVFGSHDVMIFIVRRAVNVLDSGEFVHRDRPFRQIAQPGQALACKLFAIPDRGYTGDGIKAFYRIDSGNDFVMVAANKNSAQCAHAFRYFIGAGAVTDGVPEIHSFISWRSRRETSFESFQIAVNIAEEK
jgi:hypothetical protein